jgi:hypothetical protein
VLVSIFREAYLLFYERREDTTIKPVDFEYNDAEITETIAQIKKDKTLDDIDDDDGRTKKGSSSSSSSGIAFQKHFLLFRSPFPSLSHTTLASTRLLHLHVVVFIVVGWTLGSRWYALFEPVWV